MEKAKSETNTRPNSCHLVVTTFAFHLQAAAVGGSWLNVTIMDAKEKSVPAVARVGNPR